MAAWLGRQLSSRAGRAEPKGQRVGIECFSGVTLHSSDPTRPWGSHWWGRWSETTVRRSWRAVRCTAKLCSPPSNPEVTPSVSSLSEERIASECRPSPPWPSPSTTWGHTVPLESKTPQSALLSSSLILMLLVLDFYVLSAKLRVRDVVHNC